MAKIVMTGPTEKQLEFELRGKQDQKKLRTMLKTGADILMDEIRRGIDLHGLVAAKNGGTLRRSIAATNMHTDIDGGRVDVTFQGTRTRGKTTTRNAQIGFIQNYGRRYGKTNITYRKPTNFVTDAEKTAKPKILEKWEKMMNDGS